MARVLGAYRHLSANGFCSWHPVRPPATILDKCEASRAHLLTDFGVEQFELARTWLRKYHRRQSINRRCSSYTWKHQAENEEGAYISNGALIAAALSLGFNVQHILGTPNAYVGIGKRLTPT
ncbi:MAG: hypothetical protein JNM66_03570 [Bryobacterales bacterium]|nr:hypothetical protein [Bryobacterales bacterium]